MIGCARHPNGFAVEVTQQSIRGVWTEAGHFKKKEKLPWNCHQKLTKVKQLTDAWETMQTNVGQSTHHPSALLGPPRAQSTQIHGNDRRVACAS